MRKWMFFSTIAVAIAAQSISMAADTEWALVRPQHLGDTESVSLYNARPYALDRCFAHRSREQLVPDLRSIAALPVTADRLATFVR